MPFCDFVEVFTTHKVSTNAHKVSTNAQKQYTNHIHEQSAATESLHTAVFDLLTKYNHTFHARMPFLRTILKCTALQLLSCMFGKRTFIKQAKK